MSEINIIQDRILGELEMLINHLDRYMERTWSDYFREIKTLIDKGDTRAIDSLNNIRGGMGSFFDLVICRINGHSIEKNEEEFANRELMRLGDLVLKSADKLKRLL